MIQRELRKEDLNQILKWRREVMETLRTPYLLTMEQQLKWYQKEICNRKSDTRYYAFTVNNELIGYGGIENIQWEYRTGEISILIGSEYRNKGYGRIALNLILNSAFNFMNLRSVWGECYHCGNVGFWKYVLNKIGYKVRYSTLFDRKYYKGAYYDSLYFSIKKRCEEGVKKGDRTLGEDDNMGVKTTSREQAQ